MSDRNPSKSQDSGDGNNPVGLTPRQYEVAQAIERFIASKGYSPNFEEIGRMVGIGNRANIMRYVEHLCDEGLFTREEKTTRTLVRTPRHYFMKEQVVA